MKMETQFLLQYWRVHQRLLHDMHNKWQLQYVEISSRKILKNQEAFEN